METKQVVDSILEAVRTDLAIFIEQEGTITDSVDYENKVLELAYKFANSVVKKAQGKVPGSRNLKKKS